MSFNVQPVGGGTKAEVMQCNNFNHYFTWSFFWDIERKEKGDIFNMRKLNVFAIKNHA